MRLSFRVGGSEERFEAGFEMLAIESCGGGSLTMALFLATSVPSTRRMSHSDP